MVSSNTAVGRVYPANGVQEPVQGEQGLSNRTVQGITHPTVSTLPGDTNYVNYTYIPDMTAKILRDIHAERLRQDEKWGPQFHNPAQWMTVIMEEVGEAAQEALRVTFGQMPAQKAIAYQHLREELVQVAAVAAAAIESLDMQEP